MNVSSKQKGFTLLELMMTLFIGAIILSFAVPSFSSMIANNRAISESNLIVSTLHLARSESIKRTINVSVCSRSLPRTTPETCAISTNWANGILLFTDDSGTAGEFDVTDILIHAKDSLPSQGILTATVNNIQFSPNGMAQAVASLTVRLSPCRGNQERVIAVARSGRVSTTTNACP